MSLKEELLSIKTYKEYEPQREKFRNVVRDKEVMDHLNKLYGKGYVGGDIEHGLIEELYKTPPGHGKRCVGK
jgi:hypothetical protein